MRHGVQLGLAFVGALACARNEYFVCNGDDDCTTSATQGLCQPTGSCCFSDDDCPSGQRYGERGPPSVAGECVQPYGTTSGATTTGATADASGTTNNDGETLSLSSGTSTSGENTTTGERCPPDWWDCAYGIRHQLLVTRSTDDPLTSIPVLITLDATRVEYSQMQTDGEDLRFVSLSGEVLASESIQWNFDGTSLFWVLLDTLGGAQDGLWLYYSNPVAQTPSDLAPVFGAPFEAVFHFDDDGSDATSNDNHGTPMGTLALVQGQVGDAQDFLTPDARLSIGADESIAGLFATGGTVSAWMRPRGWGGGDYGRVVDKFADDVGWRFYVDAMGRLYFGFAAGESPTLTWQTVPEQIELDVWTHVAAVHDASQLAAATLYVNGVEVELMDATVPSVTASPSDADLELTIGNRANETRQFDGVLDEVRFTRSARSPPWIVIQYDSMRDALLSYGPAQHLDGA
ncbi:MAG: DUF2341 domain-containing protein [Nannocystaceae bacterium]|nr:DUF2341 domain-containing protein [Nannocystaceae bacterium]